jgi:hypothetical protein
MLVLAILAVAVAAVGAFFWANSAQADIGGPSTTVALTSSQGATANPGDTITYTATVTQTGAPIGTVTNTRFDVTLDASNLASVTFPVANDSDVTPWIAAECSYIAPVVTCTDAIGPVDGDTVTITAVVVPGGDNDVDPPTLCAVTDDGLGSASCTGTIALLPINGVTCAVAGTFLVGTNATFTCTVPIGLTYCSDVTANTVRTFDATATGDFRVVLPATLVSGPSAGLAATTATDAATITVTRATAGTAIVELRTHLATSTVNTDCTTAAVGVNFATLASSGAVIRHVDIDCASERAADSGDSHTSPGATQAAGGDYGSNLLACNGLLSNGNIFTVAGAKNVVSGYALDDDDDAVSSAHTVCILSAALTSADNANISWSVTPTAAHQDPVNVNTNKIGVDVSGNANLEPCVSWRVGDVGVEQAITAIWLPTGETIYSNGVRDNVAQNCPSDLSPAIDVFGVCQPLVKQWNSIDSTKIVQATGQVGLTLTPGTQIAGQTASGAGTTTTIEDLLAGYVVNDLIGRTLEITAGAGSGLTLYTITGNDADTITFSPAALVPTDATTVYTIGGPGGNTSQLAAWTARDGNDCTAAASFCSGADVNGLTRTQGGTTFIAPPGQGKLLVSGLSFIEYALGSHVNYNGPVDGAVQTFSIGSDSSCGTVRVEHPTTGVSVLLVQGLPASDDSVTLPTNSDKGVGFTIAPTTDGTLKSTTSTADCSDGECLSVVITTTENPTFSSRPLYKPAAETIKVCFIEGPTLQKQPMLAWVGQRVVLEHDWRDVSGDCPWYGTRSDFLVRYLVGAGSVGALSTVPGFPPAVVTGPDYVVVRVTAPAPTANPPVLGDDCISRVIYESQIPGRVDVTAHVVSESSYTVISPEYDFWYYYMKFESLTLGIVPGSRAGHNSGAFAPQNPPVASDKTTETSNVSADVLVRVTVRGWVEADNCPVKDQAADINGLLLPANRCTFPDDWAKVLGQNAQYDILGSAPAGSCANVAGPFSLLQQVKANCGTTKAPHVDALPGDQAPPYALFRHSVFPSVPTLVSSVDAPMPPALVTLTLAGQGFLKGAAKSDIYGAANQYFATHIPAEPTILVAGSGYQSHWHSWTGTGNRSGLYVFWSSLAGASTKGVADATVISCPGTSSVGCVGGKDTKGYDLIQIYTDNHGEAMAYVNGDANLDFTACDANNLASHKIISPIIGHYCEKDDDVGSSTINALAVYPDKQPHRDMAAGPVTIDWTWGGVKEITTAPGETLGSGAISTYVIFNVTDRDGFCDLSPSLHKVLGEKVNFQIDSGKSNGTIIGAAQLGSIGADGLSASTVTFDADAAGAPVKGSPVPADSCQAWVLVSHSTNEQVDIRITAFDPEGTITFDTILNPTPPAPEPTPFTINTKWGNTDCSGDGIKARDVQALQKFILEQPLLTVFAPCPSIGQTVIVAGNTHQWGNWDCSAGGGIQARDGQALQKFILEQTALSQTSPCPAVNAPVAVQPVSIP